MKNIKIVDYYSIKAFHEVINYSFLSICSTLFHKAIYYSGKSAQTNMKKMQYSYGLNGIVYKTMPTIEVDTSWGARLRDLYGFFTTLYHYLITPHSTLLFYNYTNKISLPFILFINILLRKKVIFVFHGELEFLIGKVSYLKTSGWYKYSMMISFKYLFKFSPSYALVLGNSIKHNLLNLYPSMNNHILSICHPYFIEKKEDNKNLSSKLPIKIGTIGVMKKEKGLNELLLLSSKLKDLKIERKLELYHIGKVYTDEKTELVHEICWIGETSGLGREEFEKQIQQLDYLLFMYPCDSYKFTASGAILDAVKLNKPIIALHNDFFDYLMGMHPIGYMQNTLEGLEQVIRKIVNGELNNNFDQEFNLLSKKVSIENNTVLFKEELNKIFGNESLS